MAFPAESTWCIVSTIGESSAWGQHMGENDEKQGSAWKATVGIWVAVLVLTVATALFFNAMTPDAPLAGISLVFVAFFWFLAARGARWAWKRRHQKEAGR
ncbi:MAG TPA: hypothetical protein VHD76_21605 [Bryobacteraceae bacterium]|nr:hypothetical protein [Bryobacteraceae bacterium]